MSIDNGYCTLGDLKAVLRIVDNVDDAMLEARIEEASRVSPVTDRVQPVRYPGPITSLVAQAGQPVNARV